MISYNDMTYCTGDRCVKFATCPRALTPAVKAAAEKWWGGKGAPVSHFSNPRAQACYEAPVPDLAGKEATAP